MDEETRLALEEVGLTPDQIDAIMGLGVLAGEQPMQQRMEQLGTEQRRQPMTPGPRGRWTGRIYRHAHPTEFMAGALGSGIGAYQEQKARQRQEAILQEQAEGRKAYLGALTQALRGGVRQPQGGVTFAEGINPGSPNTGMYGVPAGGSAMGMNPQAQALRRGWSPIR